jgi:putative flippase GtrA
MKRFWLLKRWLTFNGVGVMGVFVQLGTLAMLVHGFGVHYLAGTLIAVESAVLHNFWWHQRWTWRDRPAASAAETARRLVRFHMLNGMVSLVGNLAIMAVLGGILRMDPLVANIIAIVSCSIVNFIASEVLVFKPASIATVLMAGLVLTPAPARAADVGTAELTQAAIAAWQQYERQVDARYDRAAAERDMFFIQDLYKSAGWRQRVQAGQVSMLRVDSITPGGPEPSIGDARIHHWVGAVFVPRASVDGVVRYLRDRAGRESEAFDDVIASKLIARDGDRVRVYMKLKRESVITVTYNTEHSVEYRHLDAARASSRSVATRIAEIADAGTPQEREKTPGNDHGFLWRLNAYWRYQQVDGGVLIECESVSLSRSVPLLLRPFVTGTVERIARESLQKTLASLRTELVKVQR